MTPRVREIEARLEKATKGPWETGESIGGKLVVTFRDGRETIAVLRGTTITPMEIEANQHLIAHAPSDLHWLLSELRRKDEAAVEARKALKLAGEVMDDLGWVEDDDQGQIPACAKALRKAIKALEVIP